MSNKKNGSLALVTTKPETQLAVADQTADVLQAYAMPAEFYVEGAEELTREDLTIPRLTLVQAQHDFPDAEKHIGEWYNDLMGTYSLNPQLILMGLHKTRVAFPRTYGKESQPLCGSDNSMWPRAEYIGIEVTDEKTGLIHTIDELGCAQCPFSQFGEDGTTPLCAKTYAYAFFDMETGLPVLVQAQRSGAQAAKQLNTLAKTIGRRKIIVLGSNLIKSNEGKYCVPVFSAGENTPGELAQLVHEMTLQMGNPAMRAKAEVQEAA